MITNVLVVIPAANEQDGIDRCLESVRQARATLRRCSGDSVRSHAVVALDGCLDGTASIVAGVPDVVSVSLDARCVGAARRAGVAQALDLVATGAPSDTWIASTDADCTVPADWLVRMVAHAEAGIDLALGTVVPEADLAVRLFDAWAAEYDPNDGHRHVHAANLGIRVSSYAELGGWSSLACHEDVDLVERAMASGRVRIRPCGDLAVCTSGRLTGRVAQGFAGYLRRLDGGLLDAV